MADTEFWQKMEGIAHSYNQHVDEIDSMETERSTNPHDCAVLTIRFSMSGRSVFVEQKRALLVRRFAREDCWMSRLTDTKIVISERV